MLSVLNRKFYYILVVILSLSCKRNRPAQESDKVIFEKEPPKIIIKSEEKDTDVISKNKILSARVIRILDGDTVEILYNQLPIKLRLEHIDTPEKRGKQPFGKRAKIVLSDLCFNQMVKIHSEGDFDRNGRLIGVIFNNKGLNLNKEMVRLGMAWHYKKYSSDISYDVLENEARKAKKGLWSDPNPIPPWDFR